MLSVCLEAQDKLYVFSPFYTWWGFFLYSPHSSTEVLKQFVKHCVRINQNVQNAESSHQQWHFHSSSVQGWFRQFCWQNVFDHVQLCIELGSQGNKRRIGGFKNPLPTWTYNYDEKYFSTAKIHLVHYYKRMGSSQRESSSCVCIWYIGSKPVKPGSYHRNTFSLGGIINLEMVKSYVPFQVTKSEKEPYSWI